MRLLYLTTFLYTLYLFIIKKVFIFQNIKKNKYDMLINVNVWDTPWKGPRPVKRTLQQFALAHGV